MVLFFWCRLTQVVLEKRPLNECSVVVAATDRQCKMMQCTASYSVQSIQKDVECNNLELVISEWMMCHGEIFVIREFGTKFQRKVPLVLGDIQISLKYSVVGTSQGKSVHQKRACTVQPFFDMVLACDGHAQDHNFIPQHVREQCSAVWPVSYANSSLAQCHMGKMF